jgi:hypothetical protein
MSTRVSAAQLYGNRTTELANKLFSEENRRKMIAKVQDRMQTRAKTATVNDELILSAPILTQLIDKHNLFMMDNREPYNADAVAERIFNEVSANVARTIDDYERKTAAYMEFLAQPNIGKSSTPEIALERTSKELSFN